MSRRYAAGQYEEHRYQASPAMEGKDIPCRWCGGSEGAVLHRRKPKPHAPTHYVYGDDCQRCGYSRHAPHHRQQEEKVAEKARKHEHQAEHRYSADGPLTLGALRDAVQDALVEDGLPPDASATVKQWDDANGYGWELKVTSR